MNLYETSVHGKPREILKLLAEQGPQSNLGIIARAIGDTTRETARYWRALESQGLVRRATDRGIVYALACRLATGEQELTRYQNAYRKTQRCKDGQTGDSLSAIMEFLDKCYGAEFRHHEIAQGTGLAMTRTMTNISEMLLRMAKNGLIRARKESPKVYLFSAVNDPGLNEAAHYLRTYAEQWHHANAVAAAIHRSTENVRMVVRVLHCRGIIEKKLTSTNRSCLWKWKDE